MDDQTLTKRLASASEQLSMSDSARASHLKAITSAVDGPRAGTLDERRPTRTRRLVAAAVAAAVLGPTGLAAASSGALPGDALYNVKQASERITVLFDPEIVARHRVEELEAVRNVGGNDADLAAEAQSAVANLAANHPLRERLAAVSPGSDADEIRQDSQDPGHQDTISPNVIEPFDLPIEPSDDESMDGADTPAESPGDEDADEASRDDSSEDNESEVQEFDGAGSEDQRSEDN